MAGETDVSHCVQMAGETDVAHCVQMARETICRGSYFKMNVTNGTGDCRVILQMELEKCCDTYKTLYTPRL